jgi:DNA-binding ferritin-like protein
MKQPLRTTPSPEIIKELRTKMIEHLEQAIAAADAAGDYATSYLIETAMDSARADQWPALDPRFDTKR